MDREEQTNKIPPYILDDAGVGEDESLLVKRGETLNTWDGSENSYDDSATERGDEW